MEWVNMGILQTGEEHISKILVQRKNYKLLSMGY